MGLQRQHSLEGPGSRPRQGGHGRAATAIGHVLQRQAGQLFEQLSGQVEHRSIFDIDGRFSDIFNEQINALRNLARGANFFWGHARISTLHPPQRKRSTDRNGVSFRIAMIFSSVCFLRHRLVLSQGQDSCSDASQAAEPSTDEKRWVGVKPQPFEFVMKNCGALSRKYVLRFIGLTYTVA
jgi:hypothetical protein